MSARTLSLVLVASLGACVWDWSSREIADGGADAGAGLPAPASDAGYLLNTFHTGPFDATNVDVNDTGATGFQWYLKQPFGQPDTPASAVRFDADGSVTLAGGSLDSFDVKSPGTGGFGGGAYFEAILSFDPTCGAPGAFPIWWSQALEHFEYTGSKDLWQGQAAGYAHFIGIDFMSDDAFANGEYGGILHDWAGVYNGGYPYDVTNAQGGGSNVADALVQLASGADLKQPHRYGFLWVPATGSTSGQAGFYFDGEATADQVGWSQYDCAASPQPPPGTASWTFGILDCDHPALVLSGPAACPLTVSSVDVWQATSANNRIQ